MREIVLSAGDTPKKLGNFLKTRFPIGYIRTLFRKSGVRINGRRARAADLVNPGDRIQLYLPFEAEKKFSAPIPKVTKLQVVFEDEALLLIDKPAGLAVHEGKTVSKPESLLGILESRYRDAGIQPRLAHRLDKDTSGLLLIAKNRRTVDELEKVFASGDGVKKQYLCLIVGRLPSNQGKIDFPLPGREGNPVRALTHFRVIKRCSETTLVRVTIETGRLHQIRLHFAKLGYPIVMDDQHGDFGFNKRFRGQYGLKRQFLHAEKLTIQYGGKAREWTTPLAKDLATTLTKLGIPYD